MPDPEPAPPVLSSRCGPEVGHSVRGGDYAGSNPVAWTIQPYSNGLVCDLPMTSAKSLLRWLQNVSNEYGI
jgi:hypothetical protein